MSQSLDCLSRLQHYESGSVTIAEIEEELTPEKLKSYLQEPGEVRIVLGGLHKLLKETRCEKKEGGKRLEQKIELVYRFALFKGFSLQQIDPLPTIYSLFIQTGKDRSLSIGFSIKFGGGHFKIIRMPTFNEFAKRSSKIEVVVAAAIERINESSLSKVNDEVLDATSKGIEILHLRSMRAGNDKIRDNCLGKLADLTALIEAELFTREQFGS